LSRYMFVPNLIELSAVICREQRKRNKHKNLVMTLKTILASPPRIVASRQTDIQRNRQTYEQTYKQTDRHKQMD